MKSYSPLKTLGPKSRMTACILRSDRFWPTPINHHFGYVCHESCKNEPGFSEEKLTPRNLRGKSHQQRRDAELKRLSPMSLPSLDGAFSVLRLL